MIPELSSWSNPHSDIILLLVAHLKATDQWRWEGRSLRLANLSWYRLINQSFKEVAPHVSRRALLTDVVSAAQKFESLQALDLDGCCGPCTSESFYEISKLPNLSSIRLSGLCITDAAIRSLAKSGSLRGLCLFKVLVTNLGLAAISRMPQLESLELKQLDMISNFGLEGLSSLKQLKIKRCPGISDEGLYKIGKYPNLERLSVISMNLTDQGLMGLKHLNMLEELELSCRNMTENGLIHIAALTNLRVLCLWEIEDINFPPKVINIPCLKELSLNTNSKLKGSEITSIERWPGLERLRLHGMDDIGLEELLNLESLQSLCELGIGQIRSLSESQIRQLCQLSHLTRLNLRGCHGIRNSGVAELTALTNVSELFLHDCDRITITGLQHIVQMHQLVKLTLGPNIDDECLEMITNLPNLTHLGFVLCNNITVRGLRWLKGMDSLQDCCLDWCKVFSTNKAQEFKALARMFLSDLKHIGLSPFRLGEEVAWQINEIAPLKVDDDVRWVWDL